MSEENKYILQVKDLHTSFATDAGEVRAVNGVSFNLEPGKTLGIVGESGSGKSVTSYSIMQILAETGKITGGEVLYHGEDISKWNEKQMQKFRGEKCSIIFQDPMTSLNPVFTIGNQLMEAILLHTDKDKKQARERAIEMLTLVGVNEPESRLKQYPHELSGGMRQRVMIAMALVCEPDILIADEPTTALDVTIQAQILEPAPARPIMTILIWLDTWPIEPANCLVIFRKGTTMLMLKTMPEMLILGTSVSSSAPPTSATTTYITLPILPIRGIKMLANRLPLRALKKISPFTLSKSALAPFSWQNTLMTF